MEGNLTRVLATHEAIAEICMRAIAATEERSIFNLICSVLVERSIYSAVSIGTVDKEGLKVTTAAQAGLPDFRTEFHVADLPAIERKTQYVCNDLPSHAGETVWGAEAASHGFSSMAVFPIQIANNVAAVLCVYAGAPQVFTPEELTALDKLGAIISHALVHVKLEGQKRRAQIELQRRESIYSRVTERIVGTIYEIEADGTLAFVNESQKPVLGFEPENMIGKKLASFVDPECVEAFETALREASQTHLVRAVELSMRRSGGESACVDLIVDSIEDETGRITGFVVAIRDITETKNLIQTLQKQTHELEDRVRERTERIRILDENSSQRVRNLVKQLTQISEIRDRLKRNPSMKSGFNLVLKNSMRDLSMNAGGIFLLNPLDHLVETKAISPGKNSTVRPVYSLDDPYLEFDALYSKELVSKTVGNGRSLLGTEEIHCAPISWNNIRGIIALGSDQNRKLDESELSILKLYSALVAEILKSSNLNIKPRKEMDQAGQGRCRVKPGNGYIVPDDVGLAYELFLEAIMSGTEGLCITRTAPARIRDRYSLQRTPVIWLTDEAVEGEKTVHTLQDLSILISNYVRRATKPVILIDGIEYLISHKNFESVYHLLQAKRTQMEAYQGILIVPFFRDAVETKEAKLLERELRVFGADADLYTPREALAEAQVSSD